MPPSTISGISSTGIASLNAMRRSAQVALRSVRMPPRQATKTVVASSIAPIRTPGTTPETKNVDTSPCTSVAKSTM
jgi:hypothetical protein